MLNTTLCYIEKDGRCLMLHRTKKKNDANGGKWIGVGGKCEEGESPEDCLLREVAEETGLTLTAWKYRGLITFANDALPTEYMHLYTATDYTGSLKECSEGELVWVPLEERGALPAWEGDHVFLRLLEQGAPFFSLKLVYRSDRLTGAVLDGVPMAEF